MSIVFRWSDLLTEVETLFPECDGAALRGKPGDMGALILHLSSAQDLTFAEAAEMIALRLPVYVEEDQRLSA